MSEQPSVPETEQWALFPSYACLVPGISTNEAEGVPECSGTKTINASEKFELPIPMKAGTSSSRNHIAWSFTLNAKDTYFSVEFQPDQSKEREIVSDKQLYLASRGLIEGSVPILRSGIFFLIWDNTYSYFTSKTINYRVGLKKEDHSLPASWHVNVNGWVYLPRLNSVKRRMTLALFKKILGLEDTHENTAKFEDRLRMFLTKDCANKKMVVEVPPLKDTEEVKSVELYTTDSGKFITTISILESEIHKYAIKTSDSQWSVPVRISSPLDESRVLLGTVPLIQKIGVSVVSDVDDTIKQSDVTLGKRYVLENIFLRDSEAVRGMPSLYQHWQSLGATFHYVSNSPWQLGGFLEAFMDKHGYPKGTLHLKSFSLNDHTRSALLQPPEITKRAAIYQLLRDFPDRKFVLVGDSGEKDAEIYADTARQFPDQVLLIFIRKISAPKMGSDGKLTTNPPLPPLEEKKSAPLLPTETVSLLSLHDTEDLAHIDPSYPDAAEMDQEKLQAMKKEYDSLYRDIVSQGVDLSAPASPAGPTATPTSPTQPAPSADPQAIVYKDPAERMKTVFRNFEPENWCLFDDPSEVRSSQYFSQMMLSVIEQ